MLHEWMSSYILDKIGGAGSIRRAETFIYLFIYIMEHMVDDHWVFEEIKEEGRERRKEMENGKGNWSEKKT